MPRITYLYGAPTSSYLICTTPRSGSTFLSQALTSIGIAGRPEEYFQQTGDTGVPRGPSQYLGEVAATLPESLGPPAGDTLVDPMFDPRRFTHFAEYVSWVLGTATTSNGVFGAKIMAAYMEGLVEGLRSSLGDGRARGGPPPAGVGVPAPAVHPPDPPRQGAPGRVAVAGDPDLAVA